MYFYSTHFIFKPAIRFTDVVSTHFIPLLDQVIPVGSGSYASQRNVQFAARRV